MSLALAGAISARPSAKRRKRTTIRIWLPTSVLALLFLPLAILLLPLIALLVWPRGINPLRLVWWSFVALTGMRGMWVDVRSQRATIDIWFF